MFPTPDNISGGVAVWRCGLLSKYARPQGRQAAKGIGGPMT